MNNKNKADTAQKSQTANKNNTPTGKIKTFKSAEERRKAHEEQYRTFRINALKRRCDRMGYTSEQFEEFKKKLIEQMNAPKEYRILILCKKDENKMIKEALAKADIKYLFCSDTYFYVDGNQNVLRKIREIVPTGATVHPYAKKMESVLPKKEYTEIKKPSNNSKDKALAAKVARKEKNIRIHRNKKTGEIEHRNMSERPNRHSNPTKKYTKKIVLKTLAKAKKRKPSIVVHMNAKKVSKGSKTLKKAA